jgi:hypothetical protein
MGTGCLRLPAPFVSVGAALFSLQQPKGDISIRPSVDQRGYSLLDQTKRGTPFWTTIGCRPPSLSRNRTQQRECVAPPLGEWPLFQVLSDMICSVLYCVRASRQGLRMEYSDIVESGASVTGSDPTKATQHPFRLLSAFLALPVTGPMPSKLVPLSPKPVFPPPKRSPSSAKSVD